MLNSASATDDSKSCFTTTSRHGIPTRVSRESFVPADHAGQDDEKKAPEPVILRTTTTTSRASRDRRLWFRGWRIGVATSSIAACTVLIVNILIAIVAAATLSHDTVEGIGTAYEGSCKVVSTWSTVLHILINGLSTVLLAASNYTMQCLAAPTRKEVDRAHAQDRDLDIGTPSIRNICGGISRRRSVAWWLLALSSVPIHLLFNSAVFKTLTANYYGVTIANNGFRDLAVPMNVSVTNHTYNPSLLADMTTWNQSWNANMTYKTDYVQQYGEIIQAMQNFFASSSNADWIDILTNEQCIDSYATQAVTDRADVLLITNDRGPSGNSSFFEYGSFGGFGTGYIWICDGVDYGTEKCNSKTVKAYVANWTVNGHHIEHCLSRKVPQDCKLQFSFQILGAVIACNLVKTAVMLWTLFGQQEKTLVTVGDAVASFLEDLDDQNNEDESSAVVAAQRWFSAASKKRWFATFALCLIGLGVASFLLQMGFSTLYNRDSNTGARSPFARGFGAVDPDALIGSDASSTSSSLITAILLVNCPQVVCSLLYFAYNGLFTAMLLAEEWSGYYLRRKPLRVSTPCGLQRSSYHLQLPLRYGAPLAVASSLLHWLVSESIFLTRIASPQYFGDPGMDISIASQASYSCLPLLVTIILGAVLLLVIVGSGFRRLRGHMPVAGANSRAIAAACRRPRDDVDAAYLPVSWGEVSPDQNEGFTRCCFTSMETRAPATVTAHDTNEVEKPASRFWSKFGAPLKTVQYFLPIVSILVS